MRADQWEVGSGNWEVGTTGTSRCETLFLKAPAEEFHLMCAGIDDHGKRSFATCDSIGNL